MFSSIFPKKGASKTLPSFKLAQKKDERKGGAPALSIFDEKGRPGGELGGLQNLAKPAAPRLLRHGLNFRDAKFIIAGLVVLMAAPFAEMLLGGSEEAGVAGFPSRDFSFPGSPQPHEEGVLGLAAGGPPGMGDESAVTPLNASDPTLLIKSFNGPSEAPAEAKAPPPPPKKSSGGWRDALAQAARPAVEKASHSASLPRAPGKLAGALRGLAAITGGGGGGGASVSAAAPRLAPPTSMGGSGRPAVASALSRVQATPGYKGAAMQGLSVSQGGANRGPGTGAGNRVFDGGRPGAGGMDSAYGGLQSGYLQAQNAMQGMGPGGGYGSAGGGAEEGPALNSLKDSHTQTEKETLAQMKAKMEMQKAIDLKWEKKKYNELDRKKMLEQIAAQTLAQTASQAFLKVLDAMLKKATEEKREGT